MFSTADDVLSFIKDEDVKFIDIRFCDLPGVMQRWRCRAHRHQGVLRRRPDVRRLVDPRLPGDPRVRHEARARRAHRLRGPVPQGKTLVMNFSIVDPFTGDAYSRDPRNIAAKAEAYLKSTGIADTAYFGAEAEFYVFDDVRFETKANASYYYIDSIEAARNSGREEDGNNQGYKTRFKGGYFPVPPVDHFADIRDKMCLNLAKVGLEVERSHHEVGTAGQQEINYRFNTLLRGRRHREFKYVIKNTAWDTARRPPSCRSRSSATTARDAHPQSLWKDGEPLFYDERGYGGLSDLARWYIGLLKRPGPAGLHQPDDQQLPARAGLRGAGDWSTRPATARPVCGSRSRAAPQGQAHRVPRARPVVQPLPVLRCAADGRPRRHPQPHRAAGASGQGPLRAAAG